MPTIDPEFGKAVSDLLDAHGLGDRQAVPRTTLDHVTIGKMRKGIVPNLETVEKFARGFGENVNYWREMAGYPPLVEPPLSFSTIAREVNFARGDEIKAALARRGETVIQAVKRTGIDYTVLTQMVAGQLAPLEEVELFARSFDLDPDEVRRWYGFDEAWYYKQQELSSDRGNDTPDLSRLGIGQHDSPGNRLRAELKDLYIKYTGLGWRDVPHPQTVRYFAGGEVASEREADRHLASWLASVARANPDQAAPPELVELEARLAEGD